MLLVKQNTALGIWRRCRSDRNTLCTCRKKVRQNARAKKPDALSSGRPLHRLAHGRRRIELLPLHIAAELSDPAGDVGDAAPMVRRSCRRLWGWLWAHRAGGRRVVHRRRADAGLHLVRPGPGVVVYGLHVGVIGVIAGGGGDAGEITGRVPITGGRGGGRGRVLAFQAAFGRGEAPWGRRRAHRVEAGGMMPLEVRQMLLEHVEQSFFRERLR